MAEERRKAREQALEWTREVRMESDEERERKAKKATRKKTDALGSGDEGTGEPKKKRRSKLKKAEMADGDDALFSGEDETTDRPAKKVRMHAQIDC